MVSLRFEDALADVLRHAELHQQKRAVAEPEDVALLEAAGRVLAEAVVADRDQPPFDRATRDGFAVRAAEIAGRDALRVAGQVRAGEVWSGAALRAGEAIEIMTGAPVPDGADAVVMIEHVELVDGAIRLLRGRSLESGENIVLRGSEAKQGEAVVAAGSPLGAAEIALAASCGTSSLRVTAKPRVAIVATGDELIEVGEVPGTMQIRNSNSYGLAALVEAAGGIAHRLEIARDNRDDLWERISQAREFDLVLLSGGVSMGKYDLVEEVLAEFGAEFLFTGVQMQPGKPLVFGRLPERDFVSGFEPERYFFGLPGNPVSTQVTFHCFVEPFLRVMAGEASVGPRFVQATLAQDVAGKRGLTRALPSRVSFDLKSPTVRLVGWHGSGDLAANARANCYAVLPEDGRDLRAGDVITVLLR
jgi:molybdopterin molybdotransferase